MERRDDLKIVAELALLFVTIIAVVGMHRLFLDGSFRGPLLLQVVLAHVTVAVLRRNNLRLGVSGLLTSGIAVLAVAWTQYIETLWTILPSTQTWTGVRADFVDAWHVVNADDAPVPVEDGFISATSLAIWLIVFVADWGAFRTRVSFEALLPSSTLFLFAAVLGAERNVAAGAALYTAAALFFLLVHRTWRQESSVSWAALQRQRGRRFLLTSGVALGSCAVLLAGVGGPHLPGADDPPLIEWRDRDEGERTRRVISPLVDVRGRLVDQTDLELFTVKTDDPAGAYWRVTALDQFDGDIWKSSYQTDEADGDLPQSTPPDVSRRQVTQTINISALNSIWLPAAYEPIAVDTGSIPVDYDQASSTLIIDRDLNSSDGLEYTVQSTVPSWTDDDLRRAAEALPDEIAERYLQLPADFSPVVAEEAEMITQGAETRYDMAMALQNHLREFRYTLTPELDADSRHGQNAMEQFLLEVQAGYCEQFAASFAAMARSLGIPARVAVGFTKGTPDPNEPGLFRVTGKHAHAWAEVYFEDYGWVTFDPTPGRGPFGANGWLGDDVDEEQAHANGDSTVSTTAPPAVDDRPEAGPQESEQPTAADRAQENETAARGPSPQAEDDESGPLPPVVTAAGRLVGLGLLGYVLLVPLGLALQRYVRHRRARDPQQQVNLRWEETVEQATAAGIQLAPALTVNERAQHLTRALPEVAEPIDRMARTVERNLYSGEVPQPDEVHAVRTAAGEVTTVISRRQPWYTRILAQLDARRLRLKRGRRRSAQGAARS